MSKKNKQRHRQLSTEDNKAILEHFTDHMISVCEHVAHYTMSTPRGRQVYMESEMRDRSDAKKTHFSLDSSVLFWEQLNHKRFEAETKVPVTEKLYRAYRELWEAYLEALEPEMLEWAKKEREQRLATQTKEERYSEYLFYLQTPHWERTRQITLERAGHRCQVCSATDNLQVHHNTYTTYRREPAKHLIVLCKNCHSIFHKNGKIKDYE